MLGTLGAEIFLARISFVLLIAGLVLLFGGWDYCRTLAFPLAFMFLMVPLPELVFSQITFPLQIVASKAAAAILPYLGVPALREGNIINLPTMPLEVAEACSGVRSLMSLSTLAIIYGYLAEKKMAIRLLLVGAAVPIAISANSIRIVGTGLLVEYWAPDKAEGFFHAFSGWLMFLASLALLFAAHRIVSRIGLSMRAWRAI
jgi:exosortase